jgi:hypothetical protein
VEWKHEAFFHEFIEFLIDTPYIILGVLTIWRIPILLYTILTDKKLTLKEKRNTAPHQLYLTLLDIPALLFTIILFLFMYRIMSLFSNMKDRKTTYHFVIFKEFIEFLIDLPFIIIGLTLTLYRFPYLCYCIFLKHKSSNERRYESFLQTQHLITDILSIASLPLLLFTILFIPMTVEIIQKRENFLNMKYEMIKLCLSIPLNLHWILLCYFNFLFIWRIHLVIKLIGFEKKRMKIIQGMLLNVVLSIMDVMCLIISIFLILTFLKQSEMLKEWKEFSLQLDVNNVANSFSFHKNVLFIFFSFWKDVAERGFLLIFTNFILNIPFFILFIFSFWRIPLLWREFKNPILTMNQKRMLVLNNFFALFVDLPYLFLGIPQFISIYRIKYLHQQFMSDPYDFQGMRKTIWFEFNQSLRDIFPIIGGIFSVLLSPWKVIHFFRVIFLEKENDKRREDLIEMFTWSIVDFISTILFFSLFLTIWRVPICCWRIWNEGKQFRRIIFKEFRNALKDLRFLFNLFFITYTINRFPKLMKRLYYFFRILSEHWKKVLVSYWNSLFEKKKSNLEYNGLELENVEIPQEIFFEIFSHLKGEEVSKSVELVCKNWKEISSNDNLWMTLFINNYHSSIEMKEKRKSKFASILRTAFGTNEYKIAYIEEYEKRKLNTFKKSRKMNSINERIQI